MATTDGPTWLEHLGAEESWRLLAATPVGRIGVLHDSAPEIYPVNHVVHRDTIVFRTDRGTKLAALLRSPAVCYEADGIDPVATTGWSVLVKGRAVELHDPSELEEIAAVPLRYWAVGTKAHWVRIVPEEVTGRRLWRHTPPPEASPAGPTGADDQEVHHGPTPHGR